MFEKLRELNLYFMETFRPVIYFFWFTFFLCLSYFVFGRTLQDVILGSFMMFVLAFSCGVVYTKSCSNFGAGVSFLVYLIIGFFVFYNTLVPTVFLQFDDTTKNLGVYVVDDVFESRCKFRYLSNDLVVKYGDAVLPWYQCLETKDINKVFPSYEEMMMNSCIFEAFYDECLDIKNGVKRINDYDYYIDYYKLERDRYDLFYCESLLKLEINDTSSITK